MEQLRPASLVGKWMKIPFSYAPIKGLSGFARCEKQPPRNPLVHHMDRTDIFATHRLGADTCYLKLRGCQLVKKIVRFLKSQISNEVAVFAPAPLFASFFLLA
jgi:hypothetical protein